MVYSSFGMLALVLHFIINFHTFTQKKSAGMHRVVREYRLFLYCLTVYYISDIFWGLLYEKQAMALTYVDTVLYFISMALSVLLWCRFAVTYLDRRNGFSRFLTYAGLIILIYEVVVLVMNFFTPVVFRFDPEKVYHPGDARNITLGLQVLLFLITSIYSLVFASTSQNDDRRHHRTIGLSGLVMCVFILLQATDAFVPYYAIGCLLASCLVYSFITVDERRKSQRELNAAIEREKILIANRYDYLTGLPCLAWFFEQAEAMKAAMNREGDTAVLLYIDLNGMKYFNHRNGFTEGNNLLKALAQALADIFGKERCAHIAADRFAVFTKEEGLKEQLDTLLASAGTINGGKSLPIRVGVYSAAMEDLPVTGAFDRAKIACDELQKSDVSCCNYYSAEMRDRVRRRQYTQLNIDRAIRENWIQVYFQPIVRAVNGKICNEEALARWIDPAEGFLSPAEFIPDLERAGLIYKLDLRVVELVLEKIRKQMDAGLSVVPHSINLSRSDFASCDIVEEIRKRVDGAGVGRDRITIEITESVVGSDFDFMKEQVGRFQALGFPVWMDDFGSGYSTLDVLQNIPFDLIKFDMSFTQKLDTDSGAKVILTELMKMAAFLGFDTVCEGVETETQKRFLEEIGCSKLQGFYFCKPVSCEGIMERYRSGTQIGIENPEESAYYESIGRVSLYDLDIIAGEEENSLQNAFDSIPMGIIEIRDSSARFIRSNPSYREFIRRFFGMDIGETGPEYAPYSSAFMHSIVRGCCEQGVRSFYDERMPDGSMVHAFARRISTNPITGSQAVAVAVLSVSDPADGESYADIARVLAADYYNIYVVDLETERFIEYSSPAGQDELAEERHGTGFFGQVRRDTMTRIYPDDREFFLTWFTKENIVAELDANGIFTTSYRLIDTGTPVYATLKVMRMQDSGRIILGVSVLDSRMKQREQEDRVRRERDALARVIAITEDYISLYSIDPDTGAYVECSSTDDYEKLAVPREGEDFFAQTAAEAPKHVFGEDLPAFLQAVTMENVARGIRENGLFKHHYRLILNGEPRNVTLKIIPYRNYEGEKLLAGVRVWTIRR